MSLIISDRRDFNDDSNNKNSDDGGGEKILCVGVMVTHPNKTPGLTLVYNIPPYGIVHILVIEIVLLTKY